MKKFPIVALVMCLLVALASCGGHGKLDKRVREAFVKGDTTRACYDSLCAYIDAHAGDYRDLLDADGQVDGEKLDAYINEVGAKLRPPMTWDTRHYGGKRGLSLTVYLERSGSMVPYDTKDGGGQLKKVVNDLINAMPQGSPVAINIVNDDIYPYKGTIDQFLQDRDIYASTADVGDAAYTDFQKIFTAILQAQRPGNISVLVSDLIYSPRDTRSVSVDKIFNEENSLATRVFKQYKGKSIVVQKFMGDYNGKYYPYNGTPFQYRGKRPFYLMVIGDTRDIDALAANPQTHAIVNPRGATDSYRFNQGESQVTCKVVPGMEDNAGRFRVGHGKELELNGCQDDRQTGMLRFTLAANLGSLLKDDATLCDTTNYDVQSLNGFTLAVRPIAPAMVTGNNKGYLEGMTHLLTLTGKLDNPRDEVVITLRNDRPAWFAQSSCSDDTSAGVRGFAGTTLGLDQLLGGIFDAFNSGNYFTVTVKVNK